MLNNYHIKKAQLNEIDEINIIYDDAKKLLKANGSDQWQSGYPNHTTIKDDILNDCLYILLDGEEIIGVAYINNKEEKTYLEIDGSWLNDEPYLVIHRIATRKDHYQKGVARTLLTYAEEIARAQGINNIRLDTHKLNISMQSLLSKLGYQYCGIVDLNLPKPFESKRFAYQKVINKNEHI
jgi:GNAT superfamily N-acetyltransferase